MVSEPGSIADQIASAAGELPPGVLTALAERMRSADQRDWGQTRVSALGVTAQPRFRDCIDRLLRTWRETSPDTSSESVALGLLAASSVLCRQSERESIELVWTGPDVRTLPLRRTDQALLEVIETARHSLLIVSFAVYKAKTIADAIVRAAERGVDVRICLEEPDSGPGQRAYSTVQALGAAVRRCTSIYVWPVDQRPRDAKGRSGVFHAKCAVADESLLFISSANLTEYAMSLNMELGVLLRGGRLPEAGARHYRRLMEEGVLTRFCNCG